VELWPSLPQEADVGGCYSSKVSSSFQLPSFLSCTVWEELNELKKVKFLSSTILEELNELRKLSTVCAA
jgi:hypothetical protein